MRDINMTPLIDVMLVLLVIFLVTAPLLASHLNVRLPSAQAARPATPTPQLDLTIDAQGRLFVDGQRSTLDALRTRAAQAAHDDPATALNLRADRSAPYGLVAQAIGAVQQAGLTRVALVALPAP